ncbi:MAG: integration host factor subunit alpha [Sphingomonadaceae bacterium]|nr:integration host factor subunit alpha [Sphingomonadaceae bacterium]
MIESDTVTAAPRRVRGAARAAKTSGSITRADLCEAVHAELGLARSESSDLVEQVLDQISATLIAGTNVKVSSFGSFVLRHKGLRVGRNPKTGEEVPIEPRTVMTFRPSQILRARINGGVDPGPEADDAE